MTIVLVFLDTPLESLLLVSLARAALFVEVTTTAEVEEDLYVTSCPLTVDTAVTTLTLWLVVVNTARVVLLASLLVAVLLLASSDVAVEVEGAVVVCAAWEVDEGAVVVGSWVEVGGVLDADEGWVWDCVTVVLVSGVDEVWVLVLDCETMGALEVTVTAAVTWEVVADEAAPEDTAFLVSCRLNIFAVSSQLACVTARRRARTDSSRS
jgi:hypothetical protein